MIVLNKQNHCQIAIKVSKFLLSTVPHTPPCTGEHHPQTGLSVTGVGQGAGGVSAQGGAGPWG